MKYQCGGTLINHNTILTAAHCIYKEIAYEFNGTDYLIPITLNEYYSTWESMFRVYLGAHDISNIRDNTSLPAVVRTVSKIIIVRKILQ